MGFLFWLIWAIDIATCITLFLAGDFRRSFTSSNSNGWVALLFLLCVIASPVLRLLMRRQTLGLVMVAMPILVLLMWYLIDKISGSST